MIVTASPLSYRKEHQPWNIYQSCKDLPLSVFIPCYVQGDLSGLVKSGDAPPEALQEAWLNIYSDYCDRIGGIQIVAMIEKTRAINALASKVDRLMRVVDAARKVMSPDLIASLQADGYKIEETEDDVIYWRQLDIIEAKIKPEKLRLDKMLSEMDKPDKTRKPSEEDFERTLAEISIMAKHEVDDTVTTARYCSYVKRLQAQIEAQNKSIKNGQRTGK